MDTLDYRFGGVGFRIESQTALCEGNELKVFRAGGVPVFRICVRPVHAVRVPNDPPWMRNNKCCVWQDGNGERRVLTAPRAPGDLFHPYCLRVRRGSSIDLYWETNGGPGIRVLDVLEAADLSGLLLESGGLILHASYIRLENGEGLLFSGASGAGKSTQAALWEQHRRAEVINGDRVLLRTEQGRVQAHGICFSGTSGICKNDSAPVAALVLPGKAPKTSIRPMRGLDAFRALLPQCSYQTWNPEDVRNVTGILSRLIGEAPIWKLDCRADQSAVEMLERYL